MTQKALLEYVSEFTANAPNIELPQAVLDGIASHDENPFFVTLPLGKVGAISQNRQKPYTAQEIALIEEAINATKPEGRVGHPDMATRASALPAIQWLATARDGDTLYGKGYVYKSAPDVRSYLSLQAAAKGRVGTSIWGNAQQDEAGNWNALNLTAVDLAGTPDAISVLDLRANPVITAEITNDKVEEVKTMSDTTLEAVSEIFGKPDNLLEMAKKGATAIRTLETLSEMFGKPEDITAHARKLTNNETELSTRVTEITEELTRTRESLFAARVETLVSELVEMEQLRPAARGHIELARKLGHIKLDDEGAVRETLNKYLADKHTVEIAEALSLKANGGRLATSGAFKPSEASEDELLKLGRSALGMVG